MTNTTHPHCFTFFLSFFFFFFLSFFLIFFFFLSSSLEESLEESEEESCTEKEIMIMHITFHSYSRKFAVVTYPSVTTETSCSIFPFSDVWTCWSLWLTLNLKSFWTFLSILSEKNKNLEWKTKDEMFSPSSSSSYPFSYLSFSKVKKKCPWRIVQPCISLNFVNLGADE